MSLCRFCGFLRVAAQSRGIINPVVIQKTLNMGYKSQQSIENIYPDSDTNFLKPIRMKSISSHDKILETNTSEDEPFSGEIPINKLEITQSRSSGPGGQHVNTTNSQVEIRFHVPSAEWIPQWIRDNLLVKERHRITKSGYIIVKSGKSRKQLLNQADCVDRIRAMIFSAAVKEREPSPEEILKQEKSIAKAKLKNIKTKRMLSLKKQTRGTPSY